MDGLGLSSLGLLQSPGTTELHVTRLDSDRLARLRHRERGHHAGDATRIEEGRRELGWVGGCWNPIPYRDASTVSEGDWRLLM